MNTMMFSPNITRASDLTREIGIVESNISSLSKVDIDLNYEGIGVLEVLAQVVSKFPFQKRKNISSPERRVSCHRCGNIRKTKIQCIRSSCPHTFCGRCAQRMREEHGEDVFVKGCPVCLDLCCCSNKTFTCLRVNHCYRKCPAMKVRQAIEAGKDPVDTMLNDKTGAGRGLKRPRKEQGEEDDPMFAARKMSDSLNAITAASMQARSLSQLSTMNPNNVMVTVSMPGRTLAQIPLSQLQLSQLQYATQVPVTAIAPVQMTTTVPGSTDVKTTYAYQTYPLCMTYSMPNYPYAPLCVPINPQKSINGSHLVLGNASYKNMQFPALIDANNGQAYPISMSPMAGNYAATTSGMGTATTSTTSGAVSPEGVPITVGMTPLTLGSSSTGTATTTNLSTSGVPITTLVPLSSLNSTTQPVATTSGPSSLNNITSPTDASAAMTHFLLPNLIPTLIPMTVEPNTGKSSHDSTHHGSSGSSSKSQAPPKPSTIFERAQALAPAATAPAHLATAAAAAAAAASGTSPPTPSAPVTSTASSTTTSTITTNPKPTVSATSLPSSSSSTTTTTSSTATSSVIQSVILPSKPRISRTSSSGSRHHNNHKNHHHQNQPTVTQVLTPMTPQAMQFMAQSLASASLLPAHLVTGQSQSLHPVMLPVIPAIAPKAVIAATATPALIPSTASTTATTTSTTTSTTATSTTTTPSSSSSTTLADSTSITAAKVESAVTGSSEPNTVVNTTTKGTKGSKSSTSKSKQSTAKVSKSKSS